LDRNRARLQPGDDAGIVEGRKRLQKFIGKQRTSHQKVKAPYKPGEEVVYPVYDPVQTAEVTAAACTEYSEGDFVGISASLPVSSLEQRCDRLSQTALRDDDQDIASVEQSGVRTSVGRAQRQRGSRSFGPISLTRHGMVIWRIRKRLASSCVPGFLRTSCAIVGGGRIRYNQCGWRNLRGLMRQHDPEWGRFEIRPLTAILSIKGISLIPQKKYVQWPNLLKWN